MKICVVWKEDKSRQNDSITSLWNSPTQMTLSDKYDYDDYSPSFWLVNILKQNLWSEMRYAVDNFDLAFHCWDEKRFTICTSPIIHLVCSPPPPSPPHKKQLHNLLFLISSGYCSFPGRNWKQCLRKIFGANKVHYGRCAIGDHPTLPQGFPVWRRPTALKTRTDSLFLLSPYCEIVFTWRHTISGRPYWCTTFDCVIFATTIIPAS